MDDDTFQDFIDAAVDLLDRKNAELEDQFGLGSMHRWFLDQATMTMQFFDEADRLVVEADAVSIGSHALNSDSWRWAWSNDSLPAEVRQRSETLQELGSVTGFDLFLHDHAFKIADEEMAWELAAVAVRHLGALGVYRAPAETRPLHTYVALMRIRHATP